MSWEMITTEDLETIHSLEELESSDIKYYSHPSRMIIRDEDDCISVIFWEDYFYIIRLTSMICYDVYDIGSIRR